MDAARDELLRMLNEDELRDAVLLGLMDREKAVEDARVVEARILGFDEIDESPDGSFAVIGGCERSAFETLTETIAEAEFGFGGDVFAVEIIVAVGIEEAVAEDGRCDSYALTEQGL